MSRPDLKVSAQAVKCKVLEKMEVQWPQKCCKSNNVTSGQQTEKTKLLQKLMKELDSGLRGQVSQPPTSSLSRGQC